LKLARIFLLIFSLIALAAAVPQSGSVYPVMVWQYQPANPKPLRVVYSPSDKALEYKLRQGILKAKAKVGIWYQCGQKVTYEKWYSQAQEIAKAAIESAVPLGVNPVGQLATWMQESGLDPCAIGPSVRNYAISKGILKAKKTTISYSKEEVLKMLADPEIRLMYPVVDIGLAQLLYPYYTRNASLSDMLTVIPGAKYSALELAKRSKSFETDEPWVTWPGHISEGRRKKIHWWVYKVMEISF